VKQIVSVTRKDGLQWSLSLRYVLYLYQCPVALIDRTISTLTLPPSLIMNLLLVRCLGCNKVFTPRGHSQHTSKTQRQDCRNLQGSLTFRSLPPSQTESLLAPNANPESWDMSGGTDGDTFARADQQFLTDLFSQCHSKVKRMT
jgi:hypothetical protein